MHLEHDRRTRRNSFGPASRVDVTAAPRLVSAQQSAKLGAPLSLAIIAERGAAVCGGTSVIYNGRVRLHSGDRAVLIENGLVIGLIAKRLAAFL